MVSRDNGMSRDKVVLLCSLPGGSGVLQFAVLYGLRMENPHTAEKMCRSGPSENNRFIIYSVTDL